MGLWRKHIHVCLTFHHGLITFAILEIQCKTRWVYWETHPCLSTFPSWFNSKYLLLWEIKLTQDGFLKKHVCFSNCPSWFTNCYHWYTEMAQDWFMKTYGSGIILYWLLNYFICCIFQIGTSMIDWLNITEANKNISTVLFNKMKKKTIILTQLNKVTCNKKGTNYCKSQLNKCTKSCSLGLHWGSFAANFLKVLMTSTVSD